MSYPLIKRFFDFTFALVLLPFLAPLSLFAAFICSLETGSSLFFSQVRIGRNALPFYIYKIRTIIPSSLNSSVSSSHVKSIPPFCSFVRRFKIDEFPQLYNILVGDMSFVGPRPDVPGFADLLSGSDRALLELRPGVTCISSLVFKQEEFFLLYITDAESFSSTHLWRMKTRLNLIYFSNLSFTLDFLVLILTILPFFSSYLISKYDPQFSIK